MTPNEFKDFGLYAKDHGVSSLNLHNYNKKFKCTEHNTNQKENILNWS